MTEIVTWLSPSSAPGTGDRRRAASRRKSSLRCSTRAIRAGDGPVAQGVPASLPPHFTHEAVYVGSGDNQVYALDAATGHVRWTYSTGGSDSSPVVAGGIMYVGSEDHKVYALNAGA